MRGLWREMLSLAERRRPFAVCTVVHADGSVPGKVGSTMIVTPDGTTRGTVGGAGLEDRVRRAAAEALAGGGKGELLHYDLANWKEGGINSVCGGSVDVSVLVHRPVPHLLLVGGGHCAKALAAIADALEWDLTVVDARPEYADRERFPAAAEVVAAEPGAWLRETDLAPYTHAYLLGHSWESDTDALVELAPRFPRLLGIIGSAAKKRKMFEAARRRGVAQARLDRVVIPIGLDIGAESPEEIAVSVAAEVINSLKRSPLEALEVPR